MIAYSSLVCASLALGCEAPLGAAPDPAAPAWEAYEARDCQKAFQLAKSDDTLRLRATMYREGCGVTKDWVKAAELYVEAFRKGDVAAGIELGWLSDPAHQTDFSIASIKSDSAMAEKYYLAARDGVNSSSRNKQRAAFELAKLYFSNAATYAARGASADRICLEFEKGGSLLRELLYFHDRSATVWYKAQHKNLAANLATYKCKEAPSFQVHQPEVRAPLPGSADSGKSDNYPFLPWPPPAPTHMGDVSNSFNLTGTLGDIDRQLRGRLLPRGYEKLRYFAVPGGFGLITNVEKLQSNGLPSSDRWRTEKKGGWTGLFNYARSLIAGEDAHFRLLAFIITNEDLRPASFEVNETDLARWKILGLSYLGTNRAKTRAEKSTRIWLLIYEFKPDRSKGGTILADTEGRFSFRTHLKNLGLMTRKHSTERLAIMWVLITLPAVLLLTMQTLAGKYGEDAQEAWNWMLAQVTPILAIVMASVFSGPSRAWSEKAANSFRWRCAVGATCIYAIAMFGVLLLEPVTGASPYNMFAASGLLLPLLQGLVIASISAVIFDGR